MREDLPRDRYRIDPVFADFYADLGGRDVIGPALSPKYESGGLYYQITSKLMLRYNPNAASLNRVGLVPLGPEMGIIEPALPYPENPGDNFRNGHYIWEEIIPWYERWGQAIVGLPLTEVRYNAELKRYEQYFENMGFYRLENEPAGTLHLLAYGAWKCANNCQYTSITDAAGPASVPLTASEATILIADAAIREAANRLGKDITGAPLTETFVQRRDGRIEKIYEFVVIVVDVETPGRPYLCPVAVDLGIASDDPVASTPQQEAYYWPVSESLGYWVRSEYWNFIVTHGGQEVSGAPRTLDNPRSRTVSRQCFTNLCLEFHDNAPAVLRVRPAALGYIYKELYYSTPLPAPTPTLPAQTISLNAWERDALLASGQSQEIVAAVFENDVPIADIELSMAVSMPDGSQPIYRMGPTNADGQARLTLPAITAPNGTVITYRVCTTNVSGPVFCYIENFVIWDAK
jgi:hypothetical protein